MLGTVLAGEVPISSSETSVVGIEDDSSSHLQCVVALHWMASSMDSAAASDGFKRGTRRVCL